MVKHIKHNIQSMSVIPENRNETSIKFDQVSVEEDTRIIFVSYLKINGIDARYEMWTWEGFLGESLIFVNSEVEHLADNDLWNMISEYLKADYKHTIKRQNHYCFVNYHFELLEDIL